MHPIENIMQTAMAEIKEMVDVNTIVGDPIISTDGSTIIPISKVSFGFVAGGGEYGESAAQTQNAQFPFSGGAGSGISINPVGFLIVDGTQVKLLSINGKNLLDKVLENMPDIIAKFKDVFSGDKDSEED